MDASPKARGQQDMKLHNRAMVWDLIVASRPVSRAALAKMTAMSPTSITRIVADLLAFGLLLEEPAVGGGVGRKATLLDIDREALFTLGIDIDVDSLRLCLLRLDNTPLLLMERALDRSRLHPEMVLPLAHDMYRSMLAETGTPAEKVRAAGICVGGTVDWRRGIVTTSPQLHWKNVPLREMAETVFAVPVTVENDAKAAVFEEYVRHQACRGESVAYLTVGSGIGAAIMHSGAILRGCNNAAGEIGHVTVQPGGELCDCGRHGCLYTCLSESAILERIRRLSGPEARFASWTEAAGAGEAWAVGLTGEIAGYIAMALNQILCSYDPQTVVVGGRLIHAHPGLLQAALARRGFLYEELRADVRFLESLSPNVDAVIGAAILARSAYLDALLHTQP